MQYDKDAGRPIPVPTRIENWSDKEGNSYFSVVADGRYERSNAFSTEYFDEYIYFIEQFLKMPAFDTGELKELGRAHSTWKHVSLGFFALPDKDGLLGVTECILGECSMPPKGGSIYDRASARALVGYINDYRVDLPRTKYSVIPESPPDDNTAVVYIYRMNTGPIKETAKLAIDGNQVGKLPSMSRTHFYLPVGSHEISASAGVTKAAEYFELEGNKTYFIKISSVATSGGSKMVRLSLGIEVDPEPLRLQPRVVAINDLQKCKLVEMSNAQQ